MGQYLSMDDVLEDVSLRVSMDKKENWYSADYFR